jgi:hypothetical protein
MYIVQNKSRYRSFEIYRSADADPYPPVFVEKNTETSEATISLRTTRSGMTVAEATFISAALTIGIQIANDLNHGREVVADEIKT